MPVYTDWGMQKYLEYPALNRSMVCDYIDNPDKYYWRYVLKDMPGKEETEAMAFGSAVDAYLSEGIVPGTVTPPDVVVIPAEALTSNGQRRGKKWDAWKKENTKEGITLWTEKELADWKQQMGNVLHVARQIEAHSEARELLCSPSRIVQPTICFNEPGTGRDCKSRPDFVIPKKEHVDFKTTRSVHLRMIEKSIRDFGYHVQAYMMQLGWQIERGETLPVTNIFMLNIPPFSIEVVNLDQSWLDVGAELFHEAVDNIAAKNYRREGFGKRITSYPPRWLSKQFFEEE